MELGQPAESPDRIALPVAGDDPQVYTTDQDAEGVRRALRDASKERRPEFRGVARARPAAKSGVSMGSQNATLEIPGPASSGAGRKQQQPSINVFAPGTLISIAAGGLLVTWGIRKRSAFSLAGAARPGEI